ncbi:MAG: chemotaxis protein CheD [Vicinamibacterales bacterium]|nr:chemotaxis protein CheD [Vicinamibacterales bacterium]
MTVPALALPPRPGLPGPGGTPAAVGRRLVVGIGEYAVSNGAQDMVVTHALGSCVAVCVHDPVARVSGLIHVLLPESKINPQRALEQPGAFADCGVPLLVQTAERYGLQRRRAVVSLAGGAEVANAIGASSFNIGRRNILAVKNMLWKLGVLIKGESVGGSQVRTVHMAVGTGRVQIVSGAAVIAEF